MPHGERIRILGTCDDVPELLAAADVLVSCSLYEGLLGAVLEAFALEVPVVAADGASALLVPVEDAPALAAAVVRALDDPAFAGALGAQGMETFAARFMLDASVRQMIELYEHVAHAARTRRVASR